MTDSTITIMLSVAYGATDEAYPWVYNRADARLIHLSGATSVGDVGAVVAVACYLNEVDPAGTAHAVISRLLQRPDVYLQAELAFLVNNEPIITTGCCFSLDEWRAWHDYVPGNQTPLGGHDPCPWIEVDHDYVHIWSDGGDSASTADEDNYVAPKLTLTHAHYRHMMRELRDDLQAFIHRLHEWTTTLAPDLGASLSTRFAAYNGIT